MQTIDLTPTTAEYANMARFFAKAVVDDARRDRQHDTGHLLSTFADIIAHLSRVMPADHMTVLLDGIRKQADRPQAMEPELERE